MGRWEGGQVTFSSTLRLTVGCCDLRTRAGVQMVQVTWTGAAGRTRAVVVDNQGNGRGRTQVEAEK